MSKSVSGKRKRGTIKEKLKDRWLKNDKTYGPIQGLSLSYYGPISQKSIKVNGLLHYRWLVSPS